MDAHAEVLDAVAAETAAMVALLVELVRIPSVAGSPEECGISERLERQMHEEGLEVDAWPLDLADLRAAHDFPGEEVRRDEARGLVGRLPGLDDSTSVMLNCHVDVVPAGTREAWDGDPFGARIEGDVLHGRGACDMKGGLVAAVWAVRALRRAGVRLRGDVLLACVAGEEDGGLGTYATLRRGWRADACVVPEPTGLDVVPACGGALTFRLRVRGLATHASRRTTGVSAIERFWPVWRALETLERQRNADVDPLMARWPLAYPLSIGTLHAGDWPSSVPDLLVAEGRLGVALGEDVDAARAAFERAVGEACAADAWLRDHPVEVEWWGGQFAPGALPVGSDLADRVAAAHVMASGGPEPARWGAPYGSDLRLLVGAGVPTVHYGPGDVALAHGPGERVPLPEVAACARALALLCLDLAGPAERPPGPRA